jgi:serine protease AprX
MRKNFILAIAILLVVALLSITRNALATNQAGSERSQSLAKIDLILQRTMSTAPAGNLISVIVTLKDQADFAALDRLDKRARQKEAITALRSRARASQGRLQALLETRRAEKRVDRITAFWVFNGFSVTATPEVIQELAAQPDVLKITPDDISIVPAAPLAANAPEQNLSIINAPALWQLGFYGQGVVVANMDTGVDVTHPDLANRWRGGSNSWFDPYGQHPTTPTDQSGHGTWTMGVMVAGDAGGSSIGMAPQARWIAVKIFNDAGSSTATAIHLGFQWLLDPDSNPNTADAPQVVNASWTFSVPGCNLEFQPDLQALRAAGILPVFAAGNYGPGSLTSRSPANYPEAFAVGATNNTDQIYAYSSRGPSACGELTTIYPEIVAPGVNINSTDLFGGYYGNSGTSLSAPHAAGALALLLSAYPNLTADQQAAALTNGVTDLGLPGPDNDYGYGRLNALAAYQWLQANDGNPTFTPTPIPPTATPTSTATPTQIPAPSATPTATAVPPTATNTPLPPTPTSTPLPPTPTNTLLPPTPTSTSLPPTPVPAATLHVGDLDRSATLSGSKWNAIVTVYVHNNYEQLVANAKVNGKWTNGATGTVSCTTNSSGTCQVSKTGLSTKKTSVTFTVTGVVRAPLTYQSSANHDPDGDSNGTAIAVSKP